MVGIMLQELGFHKNAAEEFAEGVGVGRDVSGRRYRPLTPEQDKKFREALEKLDRSYVKSAAELGFQKTSGLKRYHRLIKNLPPELQTAMPGGRGVSPKNKAIATAFGKFDRRALSYDLKHGDGAYANLVYRDNPKTFSEALLQASRPSK